MTDYIRADNIRPYPCLLDIVGTDLRVVPHANEFHLP